MPGQRAKNISRISVTLEDQLLDDLNLLAVEEGRDRLQIIREALKAHLEKSKKAERPKKKSGE